MKSDVLEVKAIIEDQANAITNEMNTNLLKDFKRPKTRLFENNHIYYLLLILNS